MLYRRIRRTWLNQEDVKAPVAVSGALLKTDSMALALRPGRVAPNESVLDAVSRLRRHR